MLTLGEVVQPAFEPDIFTNPVAPDNEEGASWDPERFREQQIRSLVRQIFLPGWPKACRQILFSAVDSNTYFAEICVRVGEALAEQSQGTVAIVEANVDSPQLETVFGCTASRRGSASRFGTLRDTSIQLSARTWLVARDTLYVSRGPEPAVARLRDRFSELRLDFDYSIFHGPPAGFYSDAALLGHLSDGVVMVLEAGRTRRAAAQRAKEIFQSGKARILGSVLSERDFPIPEHIYRKL